MPAGFDSCVRQGGRVRTVSGKRYGCGPGQYRRICFKPGSSKSFLGHIKTKKKSSGKGS